VNGSLKQALIDAVQAAYMRHTEYLQRRRTEAAIKLADAVLSTEVGSSEPGTAVPAAVYYAQSKGLIAGADGLYSEICAALNNAELKHALADKADAPPKAAVETASSPVPAVKELLATDPARYSEFPS